MKSLFVLLLLAQSAFAQENSPFRSRVETCPDGTSTCDLYAKQWNMKNRFTVNPWGVPIRSPQDIRIEGIWDKGIQGDRRIIVAVIDSGVDTEHPDLEGNIYTNTLEIPGNQIDDDGNGFIDDIHGWNFVQNSPDVADTIGHGTHIAGVIGGRGDNGFGIKGINWNVSILPIVYLDSEGHGNLKNSIEAVIYAVRMGAKVINASWSGTKPDALRETIAWAESQGALFVTTSGNDGENLDMYPLYPASFALGNMIVVGSSEFSDGLTGDSNWGKNTVDILAPGIEILSTLPGGRYGYMSGTSMSAPHVAGAAALLWSQHPDWTYRQIKAALLRSSRLYPDYANRIRYGRLDMQSLFAGEDNQKLFPKTWTSLERKESIHYEKAGFYTLVLKQPGASMLRVSFQDLALKAGSQRVIVSDKNGTAVQRIVDSQGAFTTDYVYGDTIELSFIVDTDDSLSASLQSLDFTRASDLQRR